MLQFMQKINEMIGGYNTYKEYMLVHGLREFFDINKAQMKRYKIHVKFIGNNIVYKNYVDTNQAIKNHIKRTEKEQYGY